MPAKKKAATTVEPNPISTEELLDLVDNPLAFLEETFASAGGGQEFDPSPSAWFGLYRIVQSIRADLDRIVSEHVAFLNSQHQQREQPDTAGGRPPAAAKA